MRRVRDYEEYRRVERKSVSLTASDNQPGDIDYMIEHRETNSHEKLRDPDLVKREYARLKKELAIYGGYMTSGGRRFRPFYMNEDIDRQNFSSLVWLRDPDLEDYGAYPEFETDLKARLPGDRELERWFYSAQYRDHSLGRQSSSSGYSSDDITDDQVLFPIP